MKNKLTTWLSGCLILLLVSCLTTPKVSELHKAIDENNLDEVTELVQAGVNTDEIYEGGSALQLAINKRKEAIASFLIESGASLNLPDTSGRFPLHQAVCRGMYNVTEQLLRAGVSVNAKDALGYTAIDYAQHLHNPQLVKLLLKNGGVIYQDGLEGLIDGPYMDRTEKGLYAYYLKQEEKERYSLFSGKNFNDTTKSIKGWEGDTITYHIRQSVPQPWSFNGVSRMVVISDIHGQYDSMIEILKTCGVIDDQLNWIFGDGHLVVIGDLFDRGGKTTECLWFVYQLEQTAEKAGGKVHCTLGNHEMMVLGNDIRYINEKYEELTESLGVNYAGLFHPNSVLGEWLRTRHTLLKINDILFVHAGISPEFLHTGLQPGQVNDYIRQYLVAGSHPGNKAINKKLVRSFGPLWYRGYFRESSRYAQITPVQMDSVLQAFNVSTVVVGHTETDLIDTFINGKVINVNIPRANKSIRNQALLIDNGKFYRITHQGKTLLK
ncbi:hypothetical protein DMA11_03550 [Marinilabiliaceae bacterium JC017]|nr:hypothetical protein DMA11_03550 [Marinilabiliaceae bacterium JC017]